MYKQLLSLKPCCSRELVDLVAFGKPFIANPNLVERFHYNTELAIPDPEKFYQGGDTGYIDYPGIYTKERSACTSF